MTTTAQSYGIGLTSSTGGFKLLSVRTIPNPESDFSDFSASVKLGNGTVRGLGLPLATWHYGYLTQAQWTALIAFCSDASNSVYISTMDNDGTFLIYTAVMVVPDKYVVRATRYMDVTITFNNLVAVA